MLFRSGAGDVSVGGWESVMVNDEVVVAILLHGSDTVNLMNLLVRQDDTIGVVSLTDHVREVKQISVAVAPP